MPVGARPRGIVFSADSKRAYVAAENSNEVYVIDAQAFTVLAKIKAGLRSNGVALHPDGKRLYVSNGGDATVSVIDLAANSAVATVPVGQRPVEHGAHARRQEALRRLRALGQRLGDRHAAGTRRSPTSPSASCHGASRSGSFGFYAPSARRPSSLGIHHAFD